MLVILRINIYLLFMVYSLGFNLKYKIILMLIQIKHHCNIMGIKVILWEEVNEKKDNNAIKQMLCYSCIHWDSHSCH